MPIVTALSEIWFYPFARLNHTLIQQRPCGSTVYIRLKDGKVWVEEDLTEDGVTHDLLEAGIPKHDIVLGFQHPRERALTEFAVA